MTSLRLIVWLGLGFSRGPEAPAVGFSLDKPDKNLIAVAKEHPDSVRDALTHALAQTSAARTAAERTSQLARAENLATAYARAWNDAFLLNEVKRFASMSAAQQSIVVRIDSLRRAGNNSMMREGIPSAMKLWRESLRLATSLQNHGLTAAPLLAVGAGFYRQGELDSAVTYAQRARQYATEAGDFRTMGNAVGVLASVEKDRGNITRAASLYAEATNIRMKSGDSRGIAADQNNLGLIALDTDNLPRAREAFVRALSLNRRENRPPQAALNLSNLGTVASREGDYSGADSLYREAIAIYRLTGDVAETGFTLHELGRLQIRRGDYIRAKWSLSAALKVHEEGGEVADAVSVRSDLAALLNASGDVEGALTTLRAADRIAASASVPAGAIADLALASGDIALQFGTFADAESEYLRAERLFTSAHNDAGRATALESRALLLHLRDDNAAATNLLDQAERLRTRAGDNRAAALTRLLSARVQASSGRLAEATNALLAARVELHALHDAVGEAAAYSSLAELNVSSGATAEALANAGRGLVVLGNRSAADVRAYLHLVTAETLRSAGKLDAAAKEFRATIDINEKTAQAVRLDERRAAFLADKSRAYAELSVIEQKRGNVGAAFDLSERLRARQMLNLLARGRIASRNAASTEEQDLRHRIAELTRELERPAPYRLASREPDIGLRSADVVRQELDQAQKNYERLMLRIHESDPVYARLISARTRSWRDVSARLHNDEVLIEYLLSDSVAIAFVVSRDSIRAVDLQTTRDQVADLIEFARGTMTSSPGATEVWRVPLRRLYRNLIEPVEKAGALRGKRALIVAPHGELHFLPFSALVAPDNHYLVERFDVSYTPSATAWFELGARPNRAPGKKVLALAPKVDRLPASLQEVNAIAKIYGSRAIVRTGKDASEAALRAGMHDAGTLHLATFGILNKHNPLFSFVELAPRGNDDGHLEVNEVFALGLNGQRVILSACQTALASGATADVPPGDDWVGLVQAFLQAGASNVVAALWPVDDRATAHLMEQFHRRAALGGSMRGSLSAAQRAMIRERGSAAPYFWAGFVSSGGVQ